MDLVPEFFIYDRTAALNEGDDPADAIVYPRLDGKCDCNHDDGLCNVAPYGQKPNEDITKISNLIGSLIIIVNKLEQEVCRSLPSSISFLDGRLYFLHKGKYTLALSSTEDGPSSDAPSALELIYTAFVTFYGGFATLGQHTTNDLDNDNADRQNSSRWCKVLGVTLRGAGAPPAAGGVSLAAGAYRELASRLALLLETVCAAKSVLGVVSSYEGRVIFNHNLKPTAARAVRLAVLTEVAEFGEEIPFNVNSVRVFHCHVQPELMLVAARDDAPPGGDTGCCAVIHLDGDLSLTLLVRTAGDADDVFISWRRLCTRLRDKLLLIHHEITNMSSAAAPTPSPPAAAASADTLKLRWLGQPSPLTMTRDLRSAFDSSASRKNLSAAASAQREQTFRSLTADAWRLARQRQTVHSVQLVHVSGYSLDSEYRDGEACFTGSVINA